MLRISEGNASQARTGILRMLIILAVAAYGAAIVQNVTQMLQGIAHHLNVTAVVQTPVR
jgi:hypothetical protein